MERIGKGVTLWYVNKLFHVPNVRYTPNKALSLSIIMQFLWLLGGILLLLYISFSKYYYGNDHLIMSATLCLNFTPFFSPIQFILEQLCNLICPSKPEPVYLLILNKAHTQEEFIRGSMTKNPYSSAELGPLMRDVKNKICHQLDLLGLLEDDYGMELLVAGNIISLDLSIAQVYEQVWKKSNSQSSNPATGAAFLSANAATSTRDCPPMTVTYRLQVCYTIFDFVVWLLFNGHFFTPVHCTRGLFA